MIIAVLLIALLVIWGTGIFTLGSLTVWSVWREEWYLLGLFGSLFSVWTIGFIPVLITIYMILSFISQDGGWMYAC